MERYESYKDSGVQWIGEIPSHWEVKRLASYFTERRVKVSDKEYSALSVTKQGIFHQLENVAKTSDGDNRKQVLKGDFVINSRSDRKGSSGVSKYDGSVSLINIVLKPRTSVCPDYCNHLLKSISFTEEFYRNGHGIVADLWTTRYDEMKMIKISVPPYAEQEAIAAYLDEKCEQIDKTIESQQSLIDLLNERKQIIINQAVTRGLNPDVTLRPSGVDWLGDIPQHWEVRRLKYSLSLINEKTNDIHLRYIALENIESFSGKLISITEEQPESICNSFCEGDILFNKLRPYLTKCIIAPFKGKCTSELLVFRDFYGENKYLQLLLLSPTFISLIDSSTYGAKMPRANWGFIGSCYIPIPPQKEQQQIVISLDEQCTCIDQAIAQKQKMITLLQERRQIIINDVVTGKVKIL